MAAPTITGVSPSEVPFLGQQLIKVDGTGFNFWSSLPAPNPGMAAKVDGEATTVKVCNDVLLYLVATEYLGSEDPHVATLHLENLDANGDPVAGESVDGVLTFRREAIIAPDDKPFLQQALETLILRLKAHYKFPITTSADVDWTPEGAVVRSVENPPGLALTDFALDLRREYSLDRHIYQNMQYRDSLFFALDGSFLLVARSTEEALRYIVALQQFQRRSPYFLVEGVRVKFKLDTKADIAFNIGEGIKSWTLGFTLEPISIECPEEMDIAFQALEKLITTETL